jgi:hemin uptake protein HemP
MDIKTDSAVTLKIKTKPLACATNTLISAHTNSNSLFAGKRELIIAHGDEHYRLRLTNQGKLILTK